MTNIIKIGGKNIGVGQPCFIIAEVGVNHNGMLHIAKSLVDIAVQAGADAVKFQKRNIKEVYQQEILNNPFMGEQSLQYLIPILKEFELSDDDFSEIAGYCKQKDIIFLCTPWDKSSANFLANMNIEAFKVASADLTNFDLLEHLVSFRRPLILSAGMSVYDEIKNTVNFLKNMRAEFILLHCNSSYPAPFHNINLNFMKRMSKDFYVPIGYSGHELGIAVSEAAVAMGACVIERHITMDRTMRGPDHASSLEPHGFIKLVRDIRNIEKSIGLACRWLTRGEFVNREALGKSLVAASNIKKGEKIKREMVIAKSPGKGISPQRLYEIVGAIAKRDILKDGEFREQDFSIADFEKKDVCFSKKWGIIVRFSDVDILSNKKFSILEFHMSDQDLKYKFKLKDYLQELVVHAPEYWGDTLLDLASPDSKIRSTTIDIFNKTISLANRMSMHFDGSRGRKVKIIVHPGGMSRDFKPQIKKNLLENLLRSLQELQAENAEILLENMPPLPWYFGVQWFHNIFVLPEEITEFLKTTGYSICFDISHAKLGCNYFGIPLDRYLCLLAFTNHVHIADAAGLDGEGLQIGEGDIDFKQFFSKISSLNCGFVPEIWQGHKTVGKGYWKAIIKLEQILKKK